MTQQMPGHMGASLSSNNTSTDSKLEVDRQQFNQPGDIFVCEQVVTEQSSPTLATEQNISNDDAQHPDSTNNQVARKSTRRRMTNSQRNDLKEKLVDILVKGYNEQAAARLLNLRPDTIKHILYDYFKDTNEYIPKGSKHIVSGKQSIGQLPGFKDYTNFLVTIRNDTTIMIQAVDLQVLREQLGIN